MTTLNPLSTTLVDQLESPGGSWSWCKMTCTNLGMTLTSATLCLSLIETMFKHPKSVIATNTLGSDGIPGRLLKERAYVLAFTYENHVTLQRVFGERCNSQAVCKWLLVYINSRVQIWPRRQRLCQKLFTNIFLLPKLSKVLEKLISCCSETSEHYFSIENFFSVLPES